MTSKAKTIVVNIKRQDNPEGKSYWDSFEVLWRPNMNVIALLMELRKRPVNEQGNQVSPPAWEAGCLEEVCGTCSMLVNHKPRQACSALVDQLSWPIYLEPFSKFPVVRDLVVNRQRMFEDLKKVHAWISIDGTHSLGPGPLQSPDLALKRYHLSECMTCGCCLEACPQYGPQSPFVGPQIINQVELFNTHPTGKKEERKRLDVMMGRGGIVDCGDAQNCVKSCPKKIPLTESIASISRSTTQHAFKKIFGFSGE